MKVDVGGGIDAKTTGYLIYGAYSNTYLANLQTGLRWTGEPLVFPTIEDLLSAVNKCSDLGTITIHKQTEQTYTNTRTVRTPLV